MASIQPVLPLSAIKKLLKVVPENEERTKRQQSKQQSKRQPITPMDDQQALHIDERV